MKTTKQEQNKVELYIRHLRELNEQGLIKLMEQGSRPDIIEIDDVDVKRGEYRGVGFYVYDSELKDER